MTQETAWQADPAAPAKQPLRYAIAQCFSENIGDRQLTGFNSPLLFDAYEGCMRRNGYTRLADPPSR